MQTFTDLLFGVRGRVASKPKGSVALRLGVDEELSAAGIVVAVFRRSNTLAVWTRLLLRCWGLG